MNLPEAFLERMKERLGSFPAFLQSYTQPVHRGLRVNTLKVSVEEFLSRSPFALTPVAWEENGFAVQEEKVGAHPYHFAGLYYSQEPSAMCAAPLLDVKRGERVLDLCAAPGGKTTQLAQAMQGEGVLIANEYVRSRAKILSQNLERMGVRNAIVVNSDVQSLATQFPAYFDKILVDAPCSGEGMFKKEPQAVSEWSEENVALCAARQREILDAAASMLRGGGRLVYSTCTFAEEEDEWQTREFLQEHPQFTLLEEHKLYPHEVAGEGHYAALFEKSGEECKEKRHFSCKMDKRALQALEAFEKQFLRKKLSGEYTLLPDGRVFLIPTGAPDLGKLSVLRAGIEMGEWDGKIFKPAHALAMAVKREEVNLYVALSEEDANRYLRGETVESTPPNGWCAVGIGDYPLGLGKIVNGTVKNHYPKGLRKVT